MSDAHARPLAVPPAATLPLFAELENDIQGLAVTFTVRVRASITGYESGALIDDADLHDAAVVSFRHLIASFRQGAVQPELLEYAADLGRRRARAAVPVESLTMALQLDFVHVWSRLLEISGGDRDATLALADYAQTLWHIVEAYVAEVLKHYRDEERQLIDERLNQRQLAVSRLLNLEQPSQATIARVAQELGCDPAAEFTVLVTDQGRSRDALYEMASELRRGPFYVARSSGVVLAFWPLESLGAPARSRIERLRGVRAQRVVGLARVPRVVNALISVLDEVDPNVDRLVELEEGIHSLARRGLKNQHIDLEESFENALTSCTATEREKLRRTIGVYLRTGSVGAAANELFYHRNTVLKHLNRFAELTGLDVTIPIEAATVVIAWAGVRDEPSPHPIESA